MTYFHTFLAGDKLKLPIKRQECGLRPSINIQMKKMDQKHIKLITAYSQFIMHFDYF